MEPYAGSYQQSDQLFKWRGLDETQETQQTHEQRVQAQAQEEHAAPIDERQQTLQKSSDVYNAVKSGSQIGVLYEGVRQPDSQIMATMDKFMNLYPKGLVPDDVRRIPFLKQTLKQILENTIRVIIELIDELTAIFQTKSWYRLYSDFTERSRLIYVGLILLLIGIVMFLLDREE